MDREHQMLLRHFQDLSRTAWQKSIFTFTDFLNLDEQSLLQENKRTLSGPFRLYGGRSTSERQIACFLPDTAVGSDAGSEEEEKILYPVTCIRVSLPGARFAHTPLTHRDYLGAVLGLGVDRSKIGDIIVEDQGAYFFCISNIASFLLEELTGVGRQTVLCETVDPEAALGEEKREEISGTVNSCRLDAILCVAFRLSRGLSQQLITGGRVYVNARNLLNTHYTPEEGDIISVRGYGKFIFEGTGGQSKKGRTQIRLQKYV